MPAILAGIVALDISWGGSARGTPSRARNEDMKERDRELRDEAAHERVAHDVLDAAERRAPGLLGSATRRIFRR